MAEDKLKMAADVCSYINEDDQHIHLEICLPGVKTQAINLKIRDDSYSLFAPRDDFDYVLLLPGNGQRVQRQFTQLPWSGWQTRTKQMSSWQSAPRRSGQLVVWVFEK